MRNYHNKGIDVCDEWKNDYTVFRDWALAHGYREDLTLDRINNNKGYSPDNCRWVTRKEQASNRSTCLYITIDGVTHTMAEWCRINNVNVDAACKRIEVYGWNPERAVTEQTRTYQKYGPYSRKRRQDRQAKEGEREPKKIEYNGESRTLGEWSKLTGIHPSVLYWRIHNWPLDKVFTTPVNHYKEKN